MLTALDQDIDKVMALRIGADDFVVKPLTQMKSSLEFRQF